MDDITEILPKLKHNKATWPHKIAAEAFIYGTPRLFAHLSVVFVVSEIWSPKGKIYSVYNCTTGSS